ncbi:hypothetical protein SAMN05444392_11564 [Seinonella peptonophila]|uniref:Uncharacterized protein n=1 Tax=Seinonella peptonophila TaxID=112248 RepID=A0A1M5ARU2_9BACL|nr:hypothetical protein [Seinonella peptonophila]SHF32894.1 hypothetical protein SAMN05444392_11564 [Seinonella peptonophila]
MGKIVNLTSEIVNLFSENGEMVASYPPEGVVSVTATANPRESSIWCDTARMNVPQVSLRYEIVGLPEQWNVTYIVSREVLNAIVIHNLENMLRLESKHSSEEEDSQDSRNFGKKFITGVMAPDYSSESAVLDSKGNIIGVRRFVIS